MFSAIFGSIASLFGYLLNLLYELVNNYGIAIILFSIFLRLILLPVTIKQQKSMEKTSKIQGELQSLQFKYKNNPEMLNKETMDLYKREKISPFSGCLSAIIQILIILSVFYLVSQPLTYMKKANSNTELGNIVDNYKNEITQNNTVRKNYIEIEVISRIEKDFNETQQKLIDYKEQENIENKEESTETNPEEVIVINEANKPVIDGEEGEQLEEEKTVETVETREQLENKKSNLEKLRINMEFLGLDLSKVPRNNMNDYKVYIIPILYVISSFISIKLTSNVQTKKKDDNGSEDNMVPQMGKGMTYIMPLMTLSIAFIAPLGLALYWFVSNLLMIGERFMIKKFVSSKEDEKNG